MLALFKAVSHFKWTINFIKDDLFKSNAIVSFLPPYKYPFIFVIKALGSHTDATEGPEIDLQLANWLCHCMGGLHSWLYHGYENAEEKNFLLSQVLLTRALCKNEASLTIVVIISF